MEDVQARHKKELKALDGEKRAQIKKTKQTAGKGKKAKDKLAEYVLYYYCSVFFFRCTTLCFFGLLLLLLLCFSWVSFSFFLIARKYSSLPFPIPSH